jgi:hypothetical protein
LGSGRFLEVIAIDPEAPAPARPRWFDLDSAAMRERLERGPALIHWVARTDDLERALGAVAAPGIEILSLSRGEFRWRIGVPAGGALAQGGALPTFIQWEGRHPTMVLPESGCRLDALVLRHPEAPATLRALRRAGLPEADPVRAEGEGHGLAARIRTPGGIMELRE